MLALILRNPSGAAQEINHQQTFVRIS